jgi:transcriptional regulator with XRE-family HTH domain
MAAPPPPAGTSIGGTALGPAIGTAQSAASAATSVLSSAIPSGADIGDFIKEQRQTAKLSLRRLAEEAGVSNPYLSQIERGLRRPSAEILQQLAKALRISAEQLYVQAGLLEDRGTSQAVEAAVVSDVAITERQKRVLLDIYASFLAENEALAAAAHVTPEATPVARPPAKKTTKKTTRKTTTRAAKKATKKAAKASRATKTSAGTTAKRTTSKSPAKKTTRTTAPRSAS